MTKCVPTQVLSEILHFPFIKASPAGIWVMFRVGYTIGKRIIVVSFLWVGVGSDLV